MKNCQIKTANYVGWSRDSSGYLKRCRDCRRTIYMHQGADDRWRPYTAWIEGDAAEGEWVLHQCDVWAAAA